MSMPERHVTFDAAGVRVTFPFEPYDTQRQFIECVVKAATNKQNALLESPTGTGKTLSLLCGSLAWQQNQPGAGNKMIYYTSRTHVQLNQAAKEMKRTAYARVPAVVIASRTHMCLNDEVKQQSLGQDQSINRACHNAIKRNACSYYSNYEQKLEAQLDVNKVHDIEDLDHFGRTTQCCPYYASKKLAETKASIVFMPYNYMLDVSLKKSTQLRLENSIVIFDEGHNIESALKDSASAQFTQSFLKTIKDSCEKLPSKLSDALNSELHGITRHGYNPEKRRAAVVDEFAKPKKGKDKEKEPKPNPIEELAQHLTNDKLQQVNKSATILLECHKELIKSVNGQYQDSKCTIDSVLTMLRNAGIDFTTSDRIITTLDSMASFWSIASVMNPATVAKYLTAISGLSLFISLIFPQGCVSKLKLDEHTKKLQDYYAAYIKCEFDSRTVLVENNKLQNWELNLWCLHPAIGLKRVLDNLCVLGPRSIIITSGTLAPMRPIETELELKFQIVREFKHLISADQLKIVLLGESPNKYPLKSTFDDTRKPEYSNAIGESLLCLFKLLPYGTIVFFPSYGLMDRVTKYWEQRLSLWNKMCASTRIFKESKEQATFTLDMNAYKRHIDSNNKAVFLGVCRGKLSEGTNLDGNHCRSVIIVGLPFPSFTDPKVVETKMFHSKRGDLGGQSWYSQQMRRAVSQAFGRVIRSKSDFGMLFLIDPRFTQLRFSLSEWIRPFYPVEYQRDYKAVANDIKEFFEKHNIDITELQLADCNGASQSGAFEFDLSTKLKQKSQLKSNTSSNHKVINASGAKQSHRDLQESSDRDRGVDYDDASDTLESRQAKMVSGYTVDKETYNRVKSALARPQGPASASSEMNAPSAKRKKLRVIFTPEPANKSPTKQNDGSIMDQPIKVSDKNITCWMCMKEPKDPVLTHCCERIACRNEIRVFSRRPCPHCNETIDLKKLKPYQFHRKTINPFAKNRKC